MELTEREQQLIKWALEQVKVGLDGEKIPGPYVWEEVAALQRKLAKR